MALPHELQRLAANAEGFRAKIAKSNRFRNARLPEALPLPLILRNIGKSRWQLSGEITLVAGVQGRGRALPDRHPFSYSFSNCAGRFTIAGRFTSNE
jgi:hypothetical protein